jgi:hypothetical protein
MVGVLHGIVRCIVRMEGSRFALRSCLWSILPCTGKKFSRWLRYWRVSNSIVVVLHVFSRCCASIISTTTACCRISSIGVPTTLSTGDHMPSSLLSESNTSTLPLLNPVGSSFSTSFFLSPPHFVLLNISFHLSKGDELGAYAFVFP